MIQKLVLLSVLSMAGMVVAQDITGKWRTIDDKTKQPRAIVQISQSGGLYTGRIISVESGVNPICSDCTGKFKGKLLAGTTILSGLKEVAPDKYDGGRITDPKEDKTYKAHAMLINGGNTLQVRGYMGVSAIGRTQIWVRVP